MNWQCHRQHVYFVNSLVLHKSGICEKCFQLFLVKLLHFFLTVTLWQRICTFGAFRFVSYWPLSCEWFYGSSVVLCFHKGKSYINLLPCPQRGQSPRSATDQLAWSWIGVCVLLIDTSAGHLKFRQEKKSTLKCFLWWLYVKMCLEHRSALWKL